MQLNAKYFGKITYTEDDLITFSEGLFGFEAYKKFLPLPFCEENDSLLSLQSVENEELSFILMNPFTFFPDYAPTLSKQDKAALKVQEDKDVSYYVICVLKDSLEQSTANLKAPVAVNAVNRTARQIILDSPAYSFRQPVTHKQERRE